MNTHTNATPRQWKCVRAFENNAPDYWLVYEGKQTFGADPIARCSTQESAERIVRAHNSFEAMKEVLTQIILEDDEIGGNPGRIPGDIVAGAEQALARAEGKE